MINCTKKAFIGTVGLFLILISLAGCLTSSKLDKFVAEQYNGELPKANKKKRDDVAIVTNLAEGNTTISTSVHKTDKFLPLLVYWKYDHRQSCALNPAIAANNFANGVKSTTSKNLTEKLNGRNLELTVQEAPATFSIVMKENVVWLIYAFSWSKIYIAPEVKDLVVAYKVISGGQTAKAGTITIKNTEKNKDLRFFQSWKSATSEYINDYNSNLTAMTKAFVTQLTREL